MPKSSLFRFVARHSRTALAFGALLIVGALILHNADRVTEAHILRESSTSVRNLRHFPIRSLVTSIMWVPNGTVAYWVIAGMFGFIVCEMRLGWLKTLLLAFGSHTVATLVSELGVLVLVHTHVLSRHHLNALDVGPSYVVVAVLVGAFVLSAGRLRLIAAFAIAPILASTVASMGSFDLADSGHVLSAVCAALLTFPERRSLGLVTDAEGLAVFT